jgi:hypothetical protein
LDFVTDWQPANIAAQQLGISPSTLFRLRRSGVLRPAVHWHRCSTGRRAPLQVNIPAARLALQVHCSG